VNGRYGLRFVLVAIGLTLVALAQPACPAEGMPELLQQPSWDEGSEDLASSWSGHAMAGPDPCALALRQAVNDRL